MMSHPARSAPTMTTRITHDRRAVIDIVMAIANAAAVRAYGAGVGSARYTAAW